MGHVGIICPNAPGHLNPMVALADAIRTRGHRVTFLLLGEPSALVAAAGFEIIPLGGAIFPPDQYRTEFQRLGSLQGLAALKHTLSIAARAADAVLEVGPTVVRTTGVTALLVDQASFPGGAVADQLGLPFATVCNALLLNPDPAVLYPLATPRERVGADPQPDRVGGAEPAVRPHPDTNPDSPPPTRPAGPGRDGCHLVQPAADQPTT